MQPKMDREEGMWYVLGTVGRGCLKVCVAFPARSQKGWEACGRDAMSVAGPCWLKSLCCMCYLVCFVEGTGTWSLLRSRASLPAP